MSESEKNKVREIFVRQLNYYMKKQNKNQMDLMIDLNLGSSTVSSWCTGAKLPRMDKIQMLANYFDVEISDLLEEKNDKVNNSLVLSESEKVLVNTSRNDDKIKRLLMYYSKLNPTYKERLVAYAEALDEVNSIEKPILNATTIDEGDDDTEKSK